MDKAWRIIAIICGIIAILGLALMLVSFMTGGSPQRILFTTDIADLTKFFTREQLESVVSFFFS